MQIRHYSRRRLMAVAAAVSVGAASPAPALNDQSVTAPIKTLNDGLLQVMKAGTGTPFDQRFNMLAPIVDHTFDLPAILQKSIGPSWSSLSSEQQTTLLQAFRRYTVASYVNSFDNYSGQQIQVKPQTRLVGSEQVVQTQIIPRSGDSHELDYVMRQGDKGWRAVDVLADGSISRVAVQRSDFRRLLERGGAQALADSLRAKSADLSDGMS
jgi:phospholipid transport system substrate-binding protein